MFSILHIPDLHRSTEEPVDNSSLLAALLVDCDRYAGKTPRIPPPHAIVVSGDIIQGARIDAPGWLQSMKDQYAVANSFLTALCDRFLDGDRSRMVLLGRVDQGRCRPQPPQIRTCGFFRIRLLDGWLRYARAAERMAVIRGRGYRARRRRNRFHGIDLFCDRRLSHFCQMWTT